MATQDGITLGDFPDKFGKLWDKVGEDIVTINENRQLDVETFAIEFTTAIKRDSGIRANFGETIGQMIKIITENSPDDTSVFGGFCKAMNRKRNRFRSEYLRFKSSSFCNVCTVVLQRPQ